MVDGCCLPQPSSDIPIICATQGDAGTRFGANYSDYDFWASLGFNAPNAVTPSVAWLVATDRESGHHSGAVILTMITADKTDSPAIARRPGDRAIRPPPENSSNYI